MSTKTALIKERVFLTQPQLAKIKQSMKEGKAIKLRIGKANLHGMHPIMVSKRNVNRLNRARKMLGGCILELTPHQTDLYQELMTDIARNSESDGISTKPKGGKAKKSAASEPAIPETVPVQVLEAPKRGRPKRSAAPPVKPRRSKRAAAHKARGNITDFIGLNHLDDDLVGEGIRGGNVISSTYTMEPQLRYQLKGQSGGNIQANVIEEIKRRTASQTGQGVISQTYAAKRGKGVLAKTYGVNFVGSGKTIPKMSNVPILSNHDFDDMFLLKPGYLGTWNKDQLHLAKPPQKGKSFAVINMQDFDDGPGTHWVCVVFDNELNRAWYFDSFGAPPPEDVSRWIKKAKKGKTIIYNNHQYQDMDSVACGWFVRYFIDKMMEPQASLLKLLFKDLSPLDFERNEHKILTAYSDVLREVQKKD